MDVGELVAFVVEVEIVEVWREDAEAVDEQGVEVWVV